MKLEIIKPPDSAGLMKATIHVTGKLGFSIGAIKAMNIGDNNYIQIAQNSEDKEDNNLYIFVTKKQSEKTMKINKAGNYYYVNTKALFDSLEIDYRKKKVMFDIIEIEYEGERVFKLIRRERDRKRTK